MSKYYKILAWGSNWSAVAVIESSKPLIWESFVKVTYW